ncbi:MAG TPA: dihydrofolate reductase [Rhizomicrobium sp.]|jgi:dihydrofolate reductase
MSRIALVVARAANGVIGVAGRIPWRIPEDMRHFKRLTLGKPCIMGRRTWESLPRKPLPDRPNIVLTHAPDFAAPGAMVVHSFAAALDSAASAGAPEVAVIGGTAVFAEALPLAAVIYLTEVHADFAGDAHFPPLDLKAWHETVREEHATPDGLRYAFITLERVSALGVDAD